MNLCACMYPGCAKAGRCLAASSCDGIPAEQLPIYWNCRAALTAYHNAGDGQIANPAGTIAAPAVEPELVAWLHEEGFKAITDDEKDGWIQSGRSGVVSGYTMPLYTHPPRTPLTDEQILDIWEGFCWGHSEKDALRLARAIEAAHGIEGEAK